MAYSSPGVEIRKVKRVLRDMGFKATHGKGGHEIWGRPDGLILQMAARKDRVPMIYIDAMGEELEAKHVMSRREFVKKMKCS